MKLVGMGLLLLIAFILTSCKYLPYMDSVEEAVVPFIVILEHYKQLEINGFVDLTREYIPYRGRLHPIAFMGRPPCYWQVVYAFHDINGDGNPELIIGVTSESRGVHDVHFIVSIYTLANGVPMSVIEHDSSRMRIYLLTDINGDTIIEHSWARAGNAIQVFYTINENGEMQFLEAIHTYDFDFEIKNNWNYVNRVRPRIRSVESVDVWGAEPEHITYLTEMEYIFFMYKFGSVAYEPFIIISEEEFVAWLRTNHPYKYNHCQAFGSGRHVRLEWSLVMPLMDFNE